MAKLGPAGDPSFMGQGMTAAPAPLLEYRPRRKREDRLVKEAIAAPINAFDRDRIDPFKRNALSAGKELCWQLESARLVEAYPALVADMAAA
jgi:hypothetical protein